MNKTLRRILIGLSLFLMLMPLGLLGYMAARGRVEMGERMSRVPRLVTGNQEYRGATYCQGCHQREYEEWSASLMGNAITEAQFGHRSRQLAWMMPPDRCLACHAPVAQMGVPKEEAITCEVCHGPGRTEAVAMNFCIACHQDPMDFILTTAREYGASPAAAEGKTCESCHMRTAEARVTHHFAGSRAAPASYEGVVTIEDIALGDEGLVVTVRNTVQGHSLPTGAEVNVLYLEITGYDASGRVALQKEYRFEKSVFFVGTMPMRVTGDNRLEAGEVRSVLVAIDEEVARAMAAVTIRPLGLDGKRRVFVVSEKAVAFGVAPPRGD